MFQCLKLEVELYGSFGSYSIQWQPYFHKFEITETWTFPFVPIKYSNFVPTANLDDASMFVQIFNEAIIV